MSSINSTSKEATRIYKTVIKDVIEKTQKDLEKIGYDQNKAIELSQKLKSLWTLKIKQRNVINFDSDRTISAETTANTKGKNDFNLQRKLESIPNPFYTDEKTMEQYTKSNVSEANIESNSFLSHGFDFFEEHFGTGLGNSENAKTKNDFNYTNDSAKDFNDDERTGKKRKAEKIRSNDEELNSDDDDSDDLVARQSPSDDFVVCHYERIARIKEKDTWRVKLGPGIMHVGGRDKVFSASDGYFKWGE